MGEAKGAKRAVLIAGPTASGKSALALRLARERGGIIVNTDALQVYDVLRLITARPTEAHLRQAPHLLYGTAVWGTYALLSPQGSAGLRAGLWDLGARGRLGPRVPRSLRPALFGAIDGLARLKAGQRLARHAACAAQA